MTASRPAIEGWFVDGDEPALVGKRCDECGTYVFPPRAWTCPNPTCRSADLADVTLSRTGTVWSYTTNHYEPPAPYISPDPFEPYTIVAVALENEGMVVLGQLEGDPADLRVGDQVELTAGVLFIDDDTPATIWRWRRLVGQEVEQRPKADLAGGKA
jgi:hypothetical protein